MIREANNLRDREAAIQRRGEIHGMRTTEVSVVINSRNDGGHSRGASEKYCGFSGVKSSGAGIADIV